MCWCTPSIRTPHCGRPECVSPAKSGSPREITSHKVNGCNGELTVMAIDEPGCGGANHAYEITGFANGICQLHFQNGPIKEAGVNGITHEVLLAILIDRMEGFQSGKFKCEENAVALEFLQGAQRVLKRRTEKRLSRGVEGTHTV